MSKSWQRWVTSLSTSSNVPASNNRVMRSRAVSLPCWCCFFRRSSPPPSSARRSRSRNRSIGSICRQATLRKGGLRAGVAERPDSLDLDHDAIAGPQRSDARGRAGGNNVPWIQGHEPRDVLDQIGYRKDQFARVRLLPPFGVDPAFDVKRRRIEADGNARSNRREGVEALGARVLPVFRLQLARGDVVEAGDAKNVVHCR